MRIGFTDQRLTAHGELVAWSAYLEEVGLRQRLREALPHAPQNGNAYDPTDTALGFISGVLCGADKLARVAHLAHDPALPDGAGHRGGSQPVDPVAFLRRVRTLGQ